MNFLAASVAMLHANKVLLIQRNRAPAEGLWTLPGGRLEPGETPEDCAIREVREELNLHVFGLKPLRVLTHGKYRLQTFGTETLEGEITPDPVEIRDWRWVSPDRIGGLRTTPRLGEVVESAFRLFDRR